MEMQRPEQVVPEGIIRVHMEMEEMEEMERVFLTLFRQTRFRDLTEEAAM